MTSDVLIVRARPGETRIARVDTHNHLKDYAVYRTAVGEDLGQVGGVYVGRVKAVLPALEAAFVDIGVGRDGFLGIAEARPQPHMGGQAANDRISDYVHEGQTVLVQINVAARDDKGPKISSRISMAGAHSILTPGDPGVRVSKRVSDDQERARLRAIVLGKLSGDVGCVLRSGAMGVAEKIIGLEIELLLSLWMDLKKRSDAIKPPCFLSGQNSFPVQFLSEGGFSGVSKIVVDDPIVAQTVEAELRALGVTPNDGVVRHQGGGDVFVDLGLADDVDGILDPCVNLKSGGSLIIEETAALTSIDVNAGRASGRNGRGQDLSLSTNIEAVWEAAKQMRLRNLAGLVVMDLMPVRGQDAMGRIVNTMKEALRHDPTGPHVLGTTSGGLLEITRPRRRPPLSHILLGPCKTCAFGRSETPLTVGLKALDKVLSEVWASPALIPALRANPVVVTALKTEGQNALTEMENKLGHVLDLIGDEHLSVATFYVEAER